MSKSQYLQRLLTCGITAAGLFSGSALAEDRFDLEAFRPMPNLADHYLSNMSARPTPHGQWTLGLFGSFADDPLVAAQEGGDRLGSIVGAQVVGRVMASVSLWNRFDIGLDVPFVLAQSGDSPIPGLQDSELPGHDAGIGDIRVVPRVVLYSGETRTDPTGFSLALAVHTYLPTGNAANFQGDGELRFEPDLAMDYAFGNGMRFNANVGYMVRPTSSFRNLDVTNALTWGTAMSIPMGTSKVHLVPEVYGAAALDGDSVDTEETPVEIVAALKIMPAENLIITAGGGTGLVQGFGTPDYRAFLGLGYRHSPDADPDKDGLIGDADACPTDAEDKDGFEDTDGCPDLDNDKDGVDDKSDRCPNDPEDKDGFQDDDGCPDLDNDNDGILDSEDKCPSKAEDKDGFEDADGCPDEDNDKDGVKDAVDKCPSNAEDVDKFQDEDGCPDPDNDNDGILDGADKCPLEAETFNGVDDGDGCPDTGGKIKLTCKEIKIDGKVYFATGKASIKKKSYSLLDQVAGVLTHAKFITKMQVEGHTDSRGKAASNAKLSQARADAVRAYLMGKNIKAERLTAVGFGEDRPIASNKSRKGRAENRRVAFTVTERSGDCK